ncbi:hypothetical protein AAH991_11480 [Microbispora sp. ZYX-F-249]|uniref:Uncharacterized protein n=1 Tax=Microbispora maris TaxID=3144104 RepID=A0ABV0AP98_9ACTN
MPAGPDDGEDEAALGAMAALDALDAHGHPDEILQIAVTDMRQIEIRRKGRGA